MLKRFWEALRDPQWWLVCHLWLREQRRAQREEFFRRLDAADRARRLS